MGELLAKHTTAEKHGNACPRKVAPSKGARSLTTISVDPESSQTAAQRRAKKQRYEFPIHLPSAGWTMLTTVAMTGCMRIKRTLWLLMA